MLMALRTVLHSSELTYGWRLEGKCEHQDHEHALPLPYLFRHNLAGQRHVPDRSKRSRQPARASYQRGQVLRHRDDGGRVPSARAVYREMGCSCAIMRASGSMSIYGGPLPQHRRRRSRTAGRSAGDSRENLSVMVNTRSFVPVPRPHTECLNAHCFMSPDDARRKCEA
jgi:hypothetical protein